MNLLPDDDQDRLVDAARALLGRAFPWRRLLSPGQARLSDAEWHQLADLGWFGLGLDPAIGGVGLGGAEQMLLFTELGRHLLPGPVLGSVLGALAAAALGEAPLAAAIAAGDLRVGLLHGPSAGRDGRRQVLDGIDATVLLAFDDDGCAIVDAASLGEAEGVDCLDPGVDLQSVPAAAGTLIGRVDGDEGARLRSLGTVLAAAFQVGIAEATLEQSVAYVGERRQFGQPVGGFQAVKHRCADMAVRANAARSVTALASLSLDDAVERSAFLADAAKVVADGAARANAAANVQNHGGIGFTWDHGAHLFVTRAEVFAELIRPTVAALNAVVAAPSSAAEGAHQFEPDPQET